MRGRRFARLAQSLRENRVETATCARALAAFVDKSAPLQLLPGGAAHVTRAALTAKVIASRGPIPWPNAIQRQLDPSDPAYLPALELHPVLAARDRTIVGLPGRNPTAWVDPAGWVGIDDHPAVSVWFADGREAFAIGYKAGEEVVTQHREDQGVSVITRTIRGQLTLETKLWPVILDGQVAWALLGSLTSSAPAPRPVRLAFAIRPATMDGAAPIFTLSRDDTGIWSCDGTPAIHLAQTGDEMWVGSRSGPDPWHRFSGQLHGSAAHAPQQADIHCGAGMASGVEVYRTTLSPDETLTRLAIVYPPRNCATVLARTNASNLLTGAVADRSGLLASGATIELEEHQDLFDACRSRLLLETATNPSATFLGALALARMGFIRRAGNRLGHALSMVHRDGTYTHGEKEAGAVLAWSCAQFVRWTHDHAWLQSNLAPLRRLLTSLAVTPLQPGGTHFFGPDGSTHWTDIWRTAALLSGAAFFRNNVPEHTQWAIAGGSAREGLPQKLGLAPWSCAENRASDGSAAGILAAAWLGVIPPDNPGIVQTAQHIRKHHWHGGGVLMKGGAHVGATALTVAVLARMDPTVPALKIMADLSSQTGAFPTARHPLRGAVGEGDDLFSAALFALLVLDQVQAEHGTLTVLPTMKHAQNLPTPFGPIEVTSHPKRAVVGRWRRKKPQVVLLPFHGSESQ